MDHQISTKLNYKDEIDLTDVLIMLIKEKRIIFLMFTVLTLFSLGGAFYEREISKKASAIFSMAEAQNQESILIASVLEKVYRENNVRDKNNLTLDEFKDRFKITGIIPRDIKEKQSFLAKKAETLEYIPYSYRIDLRIGSIGESKKILRDYYNELNNYYRFQNESRYRFKYLEESILNDEKYSYNDYLQILEERKQSLKSLINGRESTRLEYLSYGFGYRKIKIALRNLESIEILNLKNYLLATNIVRDPRKFQDEFNNRKRILENKINKEKEIAKNYKNLLDNYKFNEDIVVPKGIKFSVEDNQKEKYYVEIMENYLAAESMIINLQQELAKLIYSNQNVNIGNESERKYILDSLKNIIKNYNNIVLEANNLEMKENYINNGILIRLASPIEIVSNSKAKLIIIAGSIMGLTLGVFAVFLKQFINSIKKINKEVVVLTLFCCVGIKSYSKEMVTLQFTHKEIKLGLNPDKTPFNLNDILVKEFLVNMGNIEIDELKNISIVPNYPQNSIVEVEKKLNSGIKDYMYIPTEYTLTLNNVKDKQEIKKKIIKKFPSFYIDYFLQNSIPKYDYLKSYNSYENILESLNNLIEELESEVNLRKNIANKKEIFYEYNNLHVELSKIKNILYRDALNYIKSGEIEFDVFLEKKLLTGENRRITLEINSLENKNKVYDNILKSYKLDKKQIFLLESGDISMTPDTNLKENQYIDILRLCLNNINQQNILNLDLKKNERVLKNIKKPTEEQEYIANKKLLDTQEELNEVIRKMVEIEMKDYKREYIGSVKVF